MIADPSAPDIRALTAPPDTFAATRDALHHIAEEVIAPARKAVDGRIRLRWTPGGFGTPRFGDGRQLRVEGGRLVTADDDGERREAIDGIDLEAARWLGDYYGFVLAVLEDVRAARPEATEPILWPEHFDYALDAGDPVVATLGGSPGDEHHAEPYLYVLPHGEVEPGGVWNATGFAGAELSLSELRAAADQRAAALDFLLSRLERL